MDGSVLWECFHPPHTLETLELHQGWMCTATSHMYQTIITWLIHSNPDLDQLLISNIAFPIVSGSLDAFFSAASQVSNIELAHVGFTPFIYRIVDGQLIDVRFLVLCNMTIADTNIDALKELVPMLERLELVVCMKMSNIQWSVLKGLHCSLGSIFSWNECLRSNVDEIC